MKIIKVYILLLSLGLFVISCKESKKEEVQEGSEVEATEEGGADADAATDYDASEEASGAEGAEAAGAAAAGAAAGESAIEGETMGVEEMDVPEGVVSEHLADTPVVYPGCDMATVDETRACSKEKFIAFLQDEFNHDLAKEAGLDKGDYEIRSVVQIDKEGKCSSLRVAAPNNQLKVEVERVIASLPQMTPATQGGEAIDVVFILPLKFKVDEL